MSHSQGTPTNPYTAPYAPPPPPVKPHRVRNWVFGIGGGIVILLIGVAIGSAGAKTAGTAAQPAPTVTVTAAAQPAPAPTVTVPAKPASPAMSTMSGDGVFVVGMDIKPGTYHTTGAVGGGGGDCYYALLSSTNTSDIIDNNNVTGPATITVGPGVKAVDTSGARLAPDRGLSERTFPGMVLTAWLTRTQANCLGETLTSNSQARSPPRALDVSTRAEGCRRKPIDRLPRLLTGSLLRGDGRK